MPDPAAMPPSATVSRIEQEQPTRPLLRTMLGEVLRRTRLNQRRTLADVARAAKVSMPYLSELERGRKEASSEVLAAVCDALRIELSELLGAVERQLVDDRARRARGARRLAAGRTEATRLEAVRTDAPEEAASPAATRTEALGTEALGTEAALGAEPVCIGAIRDRQATPRFRRPDDIQCLLVA